MRNQEPGCAPAAVESTGPAVVLAPEGDDWRLAQPVDRCRYRHCGRTAVVMLNRGMWRGGRRRPVWWKYCAEHSYNRVALADGIYYAFEPGPNSDWLPAAGGER